MRAAHLVVGAVVGSAALPLLAAPIIALARLTDLPLRGTLLSNTLFVAALSLAASIVVWLPLALVAHMRGAKTASPYLHLGGVAALVLMFVIASPWREPKLYFVGLLFALPGCLCNAFVAWRVAQRLAPRPVP
jgi:hypothetical protein